MITKINKALDLMRRPGAFLYINKSPAREGCDEFWIHPGGRVEPAVGRKLIEHPQVRPAEDGMFKGLSQSFRIR